MMEFGQAMNRQSPILAHVTFCVQTVLPVVPAKVLPCASIWPDMEWPHFAMQNHPHKNPHKTRRIGHGARATHHEIERKTNNLAGGALPPEQKVGGSNPLGRTSFQSTYGFLSKQRVHNRYTTRFDNGLAVRQKRGQPRSQDQSSTEHLHSLPVVFGIRNPYACLLIVSILL